MAVATSVQLVADLRGPAGTTAADERFAALEAAIFQRGSLPANSRLNWMHSKADAGLWQVNSREIAATIQNLPAGVEQCQILVLSADSKVSSQMVFPYGAIDPAFVGSYYFRNVVDIGGVTWSEWRLVSGYDRGRAPAGANIDTWWASKWSGSWSVGSQADAAAMTGLPAGVEQCTVIVSTTLTGIATQWVYPYGYYDHKRRPYFRQTTHASLHTWTDWERIATQSDLAGGGGGGGSSTVSEAGKHQVELSEYLRRRGGKIGTNGKPVIALRFDHGLKNFLQYVMPTLVDLGLPCSLALNSGNWHYPENDGVTAAMVDEWVRKYGIEIANHSKTHKTSSGDAAIRDNIVGGRDDLRTQIPSAAVDIFMPAGLVAGELDGFGDGRLVEAWQSAAGQIIMGSHGVATGYMGSANRPLSGAPNIGDTHITGDNVLTLSDFQDRVQRAISTKTGMCFMFHPSLINAADKVTSAALVSYLQYLAGLRDAGTVEVMTVGGLSIADAGTSHRDRWTGTGSSIAVESFAWLNQRGAVRCVQGSVTGTPTVTVTHSTAGVIASRALTAGKFFLPWTVPKNINSGTYTIEVTGGSVTGLECVAI